MQGAVREIWRYPVKSMRGERIEAAFVGPRGLRGDRVFAVRDQEKREIRSGKALHALLQLEAHHLGDPEQGADQDVEITFADGAVMRVDSDDIAPRLSAWLGAPAQVCGLEPAHNLDHYRRAASGAVDLETGLRKVFALEPDEPLPDLSMIPREVFDYVTPPGTYFDLAPLHLLTTSSLARLRELLPEADIDVRRFRPNLLVDTLSSCGPGYPEQSWVGRRLRLGGLTVEIRLMTPRCVMTTLPQAELSRQPQIMRALVRDANQNLGVYAYVVEPGPVAQEDVVTPL